MAIAVIIPVVAPGYAGKVPTRAYGKIDGREIFLRCVELYAPREQVIQRIVVVPPDDLAVIQERYSAHLGFQGVTVAGGTSEWFGCVARGLERLEEKVDAVMVHDACCPAVPFTLLDAIEEAFGRNKGGGGAAGVVPVIPTRSAFADVGGALLAEYVDMARTVEVQSPQLFRRAALEQAYAKRGGETFVDDAELVMHAGGKIATVAGSRFNMRVDSEEMLRLARDLVEHMPKPKSKTPLAPFGEAEW